VATGRALLPQELGFGSGMTCWRRLRDWHEAGVWQRLRELLLSGLRAVGILSRSEWLQNGARHGTPSFPNPIGRADVLVNVFWRSTPLLP
jgi:hypothetical protein